MTQAVGSASQNVLETVAQAGSAKAGASVRRAGAKFEQAAKTAPDDSTPELTRRDPSANDDRPVQKTGKTSGKPHGDAKKSDDDDTSFAATIDSIDPGVALPATADVTRTAPPITNWIPEMAFGQIARNSPVVVKPADRDGVVVKAQSPVFSPSIPKQDGISALLQAKQRLLVADAMPGQVVDQSKTRSNPQTDSPADFHKNPLPDTQTDSQPALPPIIVQSRETHWSFPVDPGASRAFSAALATNKPTMPHPLASLRADEPAKDESEVAKPKAEANPLKTVSAPVPALESGQDAPAGQSFSGHTGGGAAFQNQAASKTAVPVTPDVAESKPADKVSTDVVAGAAGLSSATEQVRNGVITALAADKNDAAPANTAPVLTNRTVPTGQVLRSIDLTLSPPDLGTVKLRLSLNANALTVEAETSKASTAKMLNDDRKGLEQNLRDAGYDVSAVKISEVATTNSASANGSLGNGSSFQDGSQVRAGFGPRPDGGSQRGDAASGQPQQRPKENHPQNSPASDTANPRPANAVYI